MNVMQKALTKAGVDTRSQNPDQKIGDGRFAIRIREGEQVVDIGTICRLGDSNWLAFPATNNGKDFYFEAISYRQARGLCEVAHKKGPLRRTRSGDCVSDKSYERAEGGGFIPRP